MESKPRKPDKKIVAPLKDLDAAVAQSRKTKADTKALEAAHKEMKAADKDLESAMTASYRAFDDAYRKTSPLLSPPTGPVPIPYPVIAKAEKTTKAAIGNLEKAQKKHDKACTKLIKVLDKETKVLKPEAKSSGGDAAGTLKGLISARTATKAKWQMATLNVKIEGKAVARHFDVMHHNLKKADKK
jgi:uncharacterized protein DUF4150